MKVVKGHGTRNDFLLLPDADAADIDEATVIALCDRRCGLGADGVLLVGRDDDGRWFMDYRNADGSIAETCGNGIRVFARYLVSAGRQPAGAFEVATRAGVCRVEVPAAADADITVDMGVAGPLPDAVVSVGARRYAAVGVSIGNPHLVVLDAGDLEALDLSRPPLVDPVSAYPDGVNVELCQPVGVGRLRLRVSERGVGETESCGTGACAAAVALLDRQAPGAPGKVAVELPGGVLTVRRGADGRIAMSGPAVLVATAEVDLGRISVAPATG